MSDSDSSSSDGGAQDYYNTPAELKCWEDCKDFCLPFGKHKGHPIHELITLEGMDYLEYLSKWDEISPRTLSFVQYALKHALKTVTVDPIESLAYVIPFGKYQGKTLAKILKRKKGPSYLKWFAKKGKVSQRLLACTALATLPPKDIITHSPAVQAKKPTGSRKSKRKKIRIV